MSGGQQQRVALARALVIRPRILLLDEPLSNLDAKLREEMQIELRQIQRNLGTTTILVTHDQAEAMALSDRIVVMNKGRVEQIAAPQEAYERPASPFVASFLGKTNELGGHGQHRRGDRSARAPGPGPSAADGPVTVSRAAGEDRIRLPPHRIGLPAMVAMRIFQGNHWLYRVETAAGSALVIRQNAGEAGPRRGRDGWRFTGAPRTWCVRPRRKESA